MWKPMEKIHLAEPPNKNQFKAADDSALIMNYLIATKE